MIKSKLKPVDTFWTYEASAKHSITIFNIILPTPDTEAEPHADS
jgi:hypothetical protein